MGIVPVKVFGKQGAIDHDTGVLNRVSGVHEFMNVDVICGEELFTGNVAIFIDGETLTTNNNHAGVALEILNLFLEAGREGNVIGVHAGDVVAFGLGEAKIESIGDPKIGLVFEDFYTGIDLGVVFKNLVRVVS